MTFGKRRPKSFRAQLRPVGPLDIHQGRQAQKRSRLARLGVVAASILATAALVHGLGPPFTPRVGQRPDREVRVRVDSFQRKDFAKTDNERVAKADRIDPILANDPAPLRELANELVDLVEAVAAVPKGQGIESLPGNIAGPWDALDKSTFEDIRNAADTPDRRVELHRKVASAFAPIFRDGILGPVALPRAEESRPTLAIRSAAGAPPRTVSKDYVLPERVRRPDGAVAKAFAAAFSPPELGRKLFGLVAERLVSLPTLKYEEEATVAARAAARSRVKDLYETFRKGDVLVAQGQQIQADQLALLRLEHDRAIAEASPLDRLRRGGSVLVLVAALFALVGEYVRRHEQRLSVDLKRVAALCGLVVGAVGLSRALATQPWDAELIPLALAAMVLAIAYNAHLALMITFALSLLISFAIGGGLSDFLVLMGGTAAGVLLLGQVRTRSKPIKVGAVAALGYFTLTWATGLFADQPPALVFEQAAWRAGWGLMAGFLLGGSLPFVENAFGIVTGISLLELGDITHPLLQELVRRAPGTHNHSVTVGTIAEAATERIGGDALLVRIGAYFHDIGKMMKPHYFVENQSGAVNRHANLAPAMSTLIIIGHVKDGVDLGRQHHLPEPIIDLIEQHHGTTLVEYFYREAARRCDNNPDAGEVMESAFRYPGPRPQSKEAGILMISDAVESASRTLSEPTPGRIEGLVGELIQKRLDDGQFDECGLTLREIAEVRESLIKSLIGIYHGRVKYPEQRTA